MSTLNLQHHRQAAAQRMADQLSALYVAAYIGTPQEHDPFYSRERFVERFHAYTSAPGFELVTAYDDHQLIGYVFGYVLPSNARWWNGLLDTTPEGFTTETGRRTFAINELHVRHDHRGQGVASQLHAELIGKRHEERATILVRPENPARSTYIHWGYRPAARLQPYPDSPIYDALVLTLRTDQRRPA